MSNLSQDRTTAFYGWKNVTFLFLIYAITMGFTFYGFSVIFPTMIQAQGWGRGEASLAHTLRGMVVGLMTPLAALSIRKLGPAKTLRIGFAVGIVALSLLGTIAAELWQWIFLWGLVMPVTFALAGVFPVQSVVNFWFDRRRATAMGVVMTGSAVAGSVAAPLYTYLMGASGSWRSGWLAAAGFCVMGLTATFFVENAPEDLGQHPDGINPDQPPHDDVSATPRSVGSTSNSTHRTRESWALKDALRTRVVWLQMVCMISQAWAIYMVTVHGVLHLIDRGFSQMQAASAIGNFILFSGIARIPTGVVADRVEPRILNAAALLGMAIAILGLWQAPASIFLVLVISGIYGFCLGVTLITFPMITANYFGPGAFVPITGFFTPIVILAGAPLPFVAGLIFDRHGSYDLAFAPVASMVLFATVCAWFLTPPHRIVN